MKQVIAHLIGDYILQSHWMATTKTTKSFACMCHVLLYGLPFYFIGASWATLFVIVSTHFVIDRFRLARFVVFAKNFIAPFSEIVDKYVEDGKMEYEIKEQYIWTNCKATGFHSDTPPFLAVWLLIIVDNTMHLGINYLALRYL